MFGVIFSRIHSFSIRINVLFFSNTYQFCHCEEGAFFAPDAAILNAAIRHPGTKHS